MHDCRGCLAAILCAGLCAPPLPAQTQSTVSPNRVERSSAHRAAYRSGQLQGDERILHALSRFTFGLRPGDLETVRAIGLDRWFEQQLHPESIDNSALAARLADFPAMQWRTEDLLYRLPSDAMIRQAADGKVPVPQNGALHAVYINQMERYQLRQDAKQEKQQMASAQAPAMAGKGEMPERNETMAAQPEPSNEMQPGAANESNSMSMAPAPSSSQKAQTGEVQLSEAQIDRILLLAPDLRVAQLARMQQPEFDAFRRELVPAQRTALMAGLTPAQREVIGALENPKNLVVNELCEERLARDTYSNAQLQEVMTDFWLNHFNVFLHKNDETPYYLVSYQRDTIRPHALGKFEDLLEATAHSPAMLLYLDNASSMGPDSPAAERAVRNGRVTHEGINENYARELMELHTLGVNGGYTQKDVIQVARVFTGWTVDRPQRGGGFLFNENRHEPGTKIVLGKKIKERGEGEGEQVLRMLASSPATAHFLSRELAERFVGDDPPQSLVDRMAQSYMKSGGDISAVLRTLFHSPEFWSAGDYRAKVKTPLEYVVSAVRASNAEIDDFLPLVRALQGMGMPIYGSVPPTGYSWQSSAWVSSGALVSRMNFALMLASDKFGIVPGEQPAPSDLVVASADGMANAEPTEAPSASAEEQRLESLLIPGGVSVATRSAIVNQAQNPVSAASAQNSAAAAMPRSINPAQAAKRLEKQDELIAGLLLGSPEFQRR
jgi:uncharacterized protein (DUF1800 family)